MPRTCTGPPAPAFLMNANAANTFGAGVGHPAAVRLTALVPVIT